MFPLDFPHLVCRWIMAQVHFMLANGIQMLLRVRVIFILPRHLAPELKRDFAREYEMHGKNRNESVDKILEEDVVSKPRNYRLSSSSILLSDLISSLILEFLEVFTTSVSPSPSHSGSEVDTSVDSYRD